MKKVLLFSTLLFIVFATSKLSGQCNDAGNGGACANFGVTNRGNLGTPTTSWQFITMSWNDGGYYQFDAEAGFFYEFATCTGWDIELMVGRLSDGAFQVQDDNDNECGTCTPGCSPNGNDEFMRYQAQSTGVYAVRVSRDDQGCGSEDLTGRLYYRKETTISPCAVTPSYGSSLWNGYVYDGQNLDMLYGSIGTQTANNINAVWGTGQPISSGCGKMCDADNFSTRWLMNNTYTRNYYVFSTPGNDDGRRLSTNGGASWNIFDAYSAGAGTTTVTRLIEGNLNMVFDQREGGGDASARLTTCQMAGDYTFATYPTWNAYVFDNQSISDNDYQGTFTETGSGSTLISDNFGSGQPTMVGQRCGKTMDNDYYNVRYLSTKSYTSGIYVFSGSNDDGRRLSIDGGNSYIINNWGAGSGTDLSAPVSLNGSYNMVYDMYEITGGAGATLTECLMGGGDLTGYGAGTWNAYAYNTANYNFNLSDYRGFFTTGTANSTSASFTLSDATVNSLRTGACGTSISADPSVRTRVSQTFLKGIYTLSAGSDDYFRLSLSGGSSWDIQSNNTTITVSRAIPGGSATNVVYEGYDTGGPGAFAGSVTAQAPLAGTLAATTTCGAATLTWTGGNGYYTWESSPDGSSYTTLVGETNTIASATSSQSVNPGAVTYYRIRTESGGTVLYSNVIIVSPIPSNDACANATNIPSLPFTSAVVSNICATDDIPAALCSNSNPGPYKNIWWRYTATSCGIVTVSSCNANSNFNNEMQVYTGACGSMTSVTCNDDNGTACTGTQSSVTFNAVSGTTYYISVGGFASGSASGNIQISVTIVNPTLVAGSFTNTTETICSGGDPAEIGLTSNVASSGGVGTLTYKWQYQVNCTGGWIDIAGTNTASYDPPAGLTQTRCYRRVVTDICGNTNATTNFGTVTVVPGPTWATNSATPTAACVGQSITLSATVSNGSGNTITWVRATSPGGAGTTVTSGDAPAAGTYYYRPTYSSGVNGCSLADGAETTVIISADPVAPTLASSTPASGTSICLNVPIAPANVTFNTFGTSGTGGCVDEYQYTINGGTNYFTYVPGTTVITPNTPGANMVRIQSRRVCGGASCDGSGESYATIAQWSVNPDIAAPTINGLALDTLTGCGIVNIIPDPNTYSFSYYTSLPPAGLAGTGPSIAASNGGTYYITSYNLATGCNSLGYATAVLNSTTSFAFTVATTPVSCYNGSNGIAAATLTTAGTAPYTFTWSGGSAGGASFGANRTGFFAGNYSLLVSDAAGCQTQVNFQILQPSAPVSFAAPSVSSSTVGGYNINCNGGTGSITNVNVSGGNGGYTYAWTPNVSTTQSASGLSAGTYNVSVTDNKGCNASTSITLTQPNPVAYTVGIGYNCSGSTYGSATVYVNAAGGEQSGSLPYNYKFNSGSFSTLNEFTQGSNALVNFTVRDGNGCTINGSSTPSQVGFPVTATDACNAIYVSIGGSAAESGTKTCPTNLEHAITLLSPTRNKIIMQGGTYPLTIDQTLVLPSAVSNIMIDGGYTITNPGLPTAVWTKKSNAPSIFTIDPPEASGGNNIGHKIGINATDCNGLILSDLRFTVTGITTVTKVDMTNLSAVRGYGKSVYGIYLNNCSNYEITRCKITTGNASAGSNGVNGSPGTAGTNGAGGGSGDDNNESLCYAAAAGGTGCNAGGSGGLNACSGRSSGTGGTGGGGGGTGGGGGGNSCNPIPFTCSNPGVGGNGNDGGAGVNGANGSPVNAAFSYATYFVPGDKGGDGANGTAGKGGGGGGGGGREDGLCNDGSGGGGGGGGGGGCAGTGGTGGYGGGSSYGIFIWNNPNTNSGVINDYDITVGTAGAGGSGSTGGTGGAGGFGGTGGDNGCNVGAGGTGGKGGKGGDGGTGGSAVAGEALAIKVASGTSPSISGASIPSGADGVAGVTVDQDQGCTNSVITIGKGVSGTWTLPAGASIVNDLNSTTPSTSVSTNTAYLVYTALPSAPNPQDLVANGVSYKNYVNIRYDRTPPAMSISNVAPCAGVPITLTCTNNGGNPSGNPLEYEWKIITGTTASNPVGGVVNAVSTTHIFASTGTYQIRLRVKVSCCGWSAPIYTTINVVSSPSAPSVPSGLATLCELTNGITYTTNNIVGNTYNWTVNGGSIASGAGTYNPTVNWGAYTGTTSIYVTATNSCGTSPASPTLTVNLKRKPNAVAVPTTNPANFCGNTGNLVINGSGSQNVPGGNNTFTFAWSPGGQTTSNISITNSTVSQVYSLVVTEGVSGCSSNPATVSVTVNPNPVAPTFTDGATTLCANAVDTFAATTTLGTITYSIIGGSGASINATTGILSSAGTANFSVRATSTAAPCGTAFTDRAVTVTPITAAPTFTSGPISICPNATPTYLATTTGGTITYSIIGGNGAAINATTGALTSTGTANFSVRATATGTCSGPFFTDRAVTVLPGTVPATFTSGPPTICSNGTATYVATTSLGTVSYSIVGGTGAAINATTGVLTSAGTSNFSVRATTTGTCGGPYISDFAVTVLPSAGLPTFTSGPTALCVNVDGDYSATSTSGVISYSIVGGSGADIDATSGYLITSGNTNFIVRATATTPSCGAASTDRAVSILPTPDLIVSDPPTVCSPATVNITAPGLVTDVNGTTGTIGYFANQADAINNVNPLPNPTAISVPDFYYVAKTTTVGSCVDIEAIYVDISPLPSLVITNPPSVCSPATVNLTSPSIANDINNTVGTYSYFTTLADAVANTNPVLNPSAVATPGTYYIKKTTDAGGCTDIEPVTVTIATCGPITWVGGTPGFLTNWDKPTNWSPTGPPTALDAIIIPNVTYDPVISVANGVAKDVTIAAGATIGINSGFTLDVKGNWSGTTTTIVSGPGKTIFSGTAGAQTITGGGTFSTLRIDNANGATIASGGNVVKVTTALELKAGTLTTNGNLQTISTSTGTAYINDFSSGFTGSLSGLVSVERFIPPSPNGFRYIGQPVNTGTGIMDISAMQGFTVTGTPGQTIPLPTCSPTFTPLNVAQNSPYGNLMYFKENGPYGSPACRQRGWWFQTTGSLTVGRGYGIKQGGNTKITYRGTANTGTITSTATSTHTSVFTPAGNNGWNLVSNPYPSAITIDEMGGNPNPLNDMPAGYDKQIQFYITGNSTLTGSYQTYNVAINGAADIALGQGFWVRVTTPGTTPAWTLGQGHRTTQSPTYFDVNPQIESHLKVNVSGNGFADLSNIYFVNGADAGLDIYDGNKWNSATGQPTLYTKAGEEVMGINSLPSLSETMVVPMGLNPGANGNFTFTFEDIASFPQTSMIYLEDLKLGTMNNLRDNTTYEFNANLNDSPDRFMLHFQPGLQAEVADQDCDSEGSIELTQPAPTVWSTYEVKGNDNNVYATGTNLTGTVTVNNLPAQEYVVTVTHPSGYSAQEYITVNGSNPISASINASSTLVMVDEMVTLTANATNANEYVWNFGDGNTQTGSANVVHAYDAEGTYNVTLTASNSDCNSEATKIIKVNNTATGLNGTAATNLNIYGQGERVVIEFNKWGGDKADIFMYNTLGQRMESLTGVSTLKGRQELYIADIKPGYYFIQVVSNGEVLGKKVFLGKD